MVGEQLVLELKLLDVLHDERVRQPVLGEGLRLTIAGLSVLPGAAFSVKLTGSMVGTDVNCLTTTAILLYPSDGSEGGKFYNDSVRIVQESVRDGYSSFQHWDYGGRNCLD